MSFANNNNNNNATNNNSDAEEACTTATATTTILDLQQQQQPQKEMSLMCLQQQQEGYHEMYLYPQDDAYCVPIVFEDGMSYSECEEYYEFLQEELEAYLAEEGAAAADLFDCLESSATTSNMKPRRSFQRQSQCNSSNNNNKNNNSTRSLPDCLKTTTRVQFDEFVTIIPTFSLEDSQLIHQER